MGYRQFWLITSNFLTLDGQNLVCVVVCQYNYGAIFNADGDIAALLLDSKVSENGITLLHFIIDLIYKNKSIGL